MEKKQDYVNLHVHDEFSMLDGVGTVEYMVKSAKEKGFNALAQTNHGNVSGAIKFYKACQKEGLKALAGVEGYAVDDPTWRKPAGAKETENRYHFIAIAKDWDGFVSIENLLTKAHSETGFYYKPRVSWEELCELKNCIVTTSCVSGVLSHPRLEEKTRMMRDAFGDDLYFEIQSHNLDKQYIINSEAKRLSKFFNGKLIATNDAHYAHENECHAQNALLSLQRKQTESSEDRWEQIPGLYMKSYQEVIESFDWMHRNKSVITLDEAKEALFNTLEVAEKCNFSLPKFEVNLPDVDTSELGTNDPIVALHKLCRIGWSKRFHFSMNSQEGKVYFERLQHELKLIEKLGFEKYFLIVWDLLKFAKSNKIAVGSGRGSGSGSLVCYLLFITHADPIHYGLIFERFINPERVDLPDLDLDFDHNRREEVYRYLQSKYHVAHIPTYNGMNAKMVLKDVSRYKEIPLEEVDAVCKELDANTPKQELMKLTLQGCLDNPDKYPLLAEFSKKNYSVIEIAKVLEGQVRQTGVHAGGVIISKEPLTNRVALEWRKGDVAINFDMYDVADLGLLKLDVLGSKTVSVLDYACRMVEDKAKNYYKDDQYVLDLNKINLEDKKVLHQFNIGETTAIFQFESGGIRKMLKEMAPHTIDTLITANAMYRPGPLQFKDTYIKNKSNPSLIKPTGNEELDRITASTYGVFIYQEQVMQIAHGVAGYTYPEADALRKIIAKSKGKDELEKGREKFVSGCVEYGKISNQMANHIFDQIVDFGRYAFNKSHATTYTLISYYAMWLRTYFPYQFLCAQIAYTEDKDKRANIYKEAKRLGLRCLPPDINSSDALCKVDVIGGQEYLRSGMSEVDGLGNVVIDCILQTRGDSKFLSFDDLMQRLDNKRIVNIRIQEIILKSGMFSSIHDYKESIRLANSLRKQTPESSYQTGSLF